MLRFLSIYNFAIISNLELAMGTGLTVLTGETGAGKSIIVEALSLLLGGRADGTVVRYGTTQARIEGVFSLDESLRIKINTGLPELGLDPTDNDLIIGREINLEGKNVCRIGGRIVPLRMLEELGQLLVDIHGQGQHLSLYRVREHIDILDRYAGLANLRSQLTGYITQLREIRKEMTSLQQYEQAWAERKDLLQYQITEIESANLVAGEDLALQQERALIANVQKLLHLANEAYENLRDREGAALDLFSQAARSISQIERLDPSVRPAGETAEAIFHQTEDLANILRIYRDNLDQSPERLQEVEERLDQLDRLKRKFGDSLEGISSYAQQASEELNQIIFDEDRVPQLVKQERTLLARASKDASSLSQARREAAKRMAREVEIELAELAMERIRFEINVQQEPADDGLLLQSGEGPLAFDDTGVDRVEFVMAPYPGEPLRALARIASGGEAARLMLAIKSIVFAADEVPTLVFDEVDAGIGGRIGKMIGQKLRNIAKQHLVLCVTHLPQIACFADHHLKVTKGFERDRIVTSVEQLEGDARVTEISQMLGSETHATFTSAKEMLQEAFEWKSSLDTYSV